MTYVLFATQNSSLKYILGLTDQNFFYRGFMYKKNKKVNQIAIQFLIKN